MVSQPIRTYKKAPVRTYKKALTLSLDYTGKYPRNISKHVVFSWLVIQETY